MNEDKIRIVGEGKMKISMNTNIKEIKRKYKRTNKRKIRHENKRRNGSDGKNEDKHENKQK